MNQNSAKESYSIAIKEVDKDLEEDSLIISNKNQSIKNEAENIPKTIVNHQNHESTQKHNAQTSNLEEQINQSQINNSIILTDQNASMTQRMKQSEVSSVVQQQMMTKSINLYFHNISKELLKSEVLKEHSAIQAVRKIKKQLKNGQLSIADHSKFIKIDQEKQQKLAKEDEIIKKLEKEKIYAIKKLRQIQHEQFNLMSHRKSKSMRLIKPLQVHKTTAEQKIKVLQILKIQKQFQESLEKKKQDMLLKLEELKIDQKRKNSEELGRQHQKKREEIKKRLNELEIKSKKRQEQYQQSKLIEHRKYSYQKAEKKIKQLQKSMEKERNQKLKQIGEKTKLKIEDIKIHEKNYEKRLKQLKNESRVSRSPSINDLKAFPKNKYSLLVEEQLFDNKQKQYERLMKIKEHKIKQKVVKYQEYIDQHFKPKIDPEKTMVSKINEISTSALTRQQRIQKGMQYLTFVKELKKQNSKSTGGLTEKHETVKSTASVKSELGHQVSYLRRQFSMDPIEKQFKQLISQKIKVNNGYQNAIRAKFLAEGLDAKAKKIGDNKIFYSLKNKLQLLEGMY